MNWRNDPRTCWEMDRIVSYVHHKKFRRLQRLKFFSCTWDNYLNCPASARIIFFNWSLKPHLTNISLPINEHNNNDNNTQKHFELSALIRLLSGRQSTIGNAYVLGNLEMTLVKLTLLWEDNQFSRRHALKFDRVTATVGDWPQYRAGQFR